MLRRASLSMAIAALAGCTGGGDARDAAIDAQAASLGVVRIERPTRVGDPSFAEGRASLSAAFAEYSGVDGPTVLDLVTGPAGALTLSGVDEACELSGEPLLTELDATVDLIEAGAVHVGIDGEEARLLPRTFPELGSLVAGVVYAEDAELVPARADLDEYLVRLEGSDRIGGFELRAVAPPGFAELGVNGFAMTTGSVFAAPITRDRGAVVTWDAGDPEDRVELEIVAGGQALVCVGRDDGSLHVDAETLAALSASNQGRLVVRRVRTQPFDTQGIEAGYLSIASTTSVRVVVR